MLKDLIKADFGQISPKPGRFPRNISGESLITSAPQNNRSLSRRGFILGALKLLPAAIMIGCGPAQQKIIIKYEGDESSIPLGHSGAYSAFNKMKRFLSSIRFYVSGGKKGWELKQTSSSSCSDECVSNIIGNGWDTDLLYSLQEKANNNRLPFLSPRLRFLIDNSDKKWLFSLYSNCDDLDAGEKFAIAVNFSRIISAKEKELAHIIIFTHEYNHVKDHIYFSLTDNNIFDHDNYLKRAKNNLIKNGINIEPIKEFNQSTKRLSIFYRNLDIMVWKRYMAGKTDMRLAIHLVEVRAWAKTPPDQARILFPARLEYFYNNLNDIERLALYLLIAEQIGENEHINNIKNAVWKLSPEEISLFQDLYDLFHVQYEVAKRFIDYSKIGIPPK